jgi:hypothetical protein
MQYVVGGEIRLREFILPSLGEIYMGHPDWDKSGFVLIPVASNGDYYWAKRSIVQERSRIIYGARGPVLSIEIDDEGEKLFPSTRGALVS